MNLIEDINYELEKLTLSKKQLRKFGFTIGLILIIISLYLLFKFRISTSIIILFSIGIFFLLFGFLLPRKLKLVYKYWMLIAFFLGWFVSRIILTILFILIITPIGFIIKFTKNYFLDLDFKNKKETYWVKKIKNNSQIEKMY